ncbi:MAG TPA: hypothetical protein VFA46_15710, partial [Actinomycetes bacterium]|nr:hypothetical protein [Actinomycetes bacterium]
MNERYRYGYGEDFPNRDFPFSRRGAMTDHRDEESSSRETEVDEHPKRADEEEEDIEERQAERIREAQSADEPRASDPGATMPFQPERDRPTPPARDETAEPRAAGSEDAERGREGPGPHAADPHATGAHDAGAGDAGTRRPAAPPPRESIFDVGDEPIEQLERPAAERERAPAGTQEPGPASRACQAGGNLLRRSGAAAGRSR